MAHTGLLALPTTSPSPYRNPRRDTSSSSTGLRRSTVFSTLDSSSSSACSTSEQTTPPPQKFTYSRASPSIRWPNLKFQQETPIPHPHHFHTSPPPIPTVQIQHQDSTDATPDDQDSTDTTPDDKTLVSDDKTLVSGDKTTLEAMSRTRKKKMTKLALKRAKDWRQRVQFLTDRILNLRPGEYVADVLDDRLVQMTPADFCFVVKWVGKSSWQRALEAYEWLNLRHWYAPNARMLATILGVLGKARQEGLAEEIFNRAEEGVGDVVQVYNAMMGVYARNGRFSKVQELLSVMRSRGCEPDLVSFNTLINARAKSGSMTPGSALQLLHEVRRSGLRPDIITYNTLISACSHGSDLEEAVTVYDDLKKNNCLPDLWTYNTMISVYGRCGMVQEAEQLFKDLGAKGFFPDAVTYNSMLYAFAREGDVEKVESFCEEMEGAGFKKDEIWYNTIIHMYGKQGRHDLAFQMYNDMKLAGRNPDTITYTVLIDSLGKAGQITKAANVMSEMVEAQVRPTLRTFSALICGYAKAGMRIEAEETFDCMRRSGIKPDHLAYSVMLDILLRFSETRKAMTLYREMICDGFKPDQPLYQIMLQLYGKENRDEDVKKLIKDMEELCGMSSPTIFFVLVKAECFDHAAEMLKLAVSKGYEPDSENLSAILNSFSSSGRHDQAHALLSFLKEHSPNSSGLITEASIVMLCEDRQLEAAMEEYNKIKRFGFDGSCSVYESLIKCCEETEFYAAASQLLSDMKFYSAEPSESVFQSAVVIYCKMGFPETAHHWVDQAESNGILSNDHSIYVTLIETYGKLKLWQRAESFVGRLRLHSPVDRKIWNALIGAYAASGRYEQARAVFNRMMKDGPSPTVDTVNGLMEALIVDGRLDELYVVIQELQDMGIKISKSTILLMLDAFVKAGNIFESKKIYHGMKAAGFLPTIHLYRSMIGLLSRGKRVRDVELMVTEMEGAGFKPDLTIFNSLLGMYTKIGDFKKTAEVFRSIQEHGFKGDDDTYNTLILMYCRDLRPEEGLSLLYEMKKQGLEPKLDSYKSLLSACARQQLVEQAEDLFEDLRSKGCKLDRFVYHTMMKVYRNSGNHSKAENMLVLMKEAGVQPTIATIHMLMLSYGTAGQPQDVENVLNNLKNSGLSVGTIPYCSVIDAYLKICDYKSGIEKLSEMMKDGKEPDCRIWTCFIKAASLCQQTSEALLLLNSMSDAGFDFPVRLLMGKGEPVSLVQELDTLLDQLGSFEDNVAFNFVNSLENLLWAFERRATASWVFQLAIRKSIYRHDVFRVADKDWGADFRKLSAGAALVGLTLWLDHMQDASLQGLPESPKSVVLITGTAEYNLISLEKTLRAYLWEMGSPFLPCKTRSGLLIAKAHSLRMWLKDSPFCMDLELKDATSLPESNSMRLCEGCFMRAGLVPVSKDIHERLGNVWPKKFARLALLSDERRDKVIRADIEGRKAKLEKMKKRVGIVGPRKSMNFRRKRYIRRQHQIPATLD
ncbi:hypothetical protein AAC387_Pa07g2148 [Persea americana]